MIVSIKKNPWLRNKKNSPTLTTLFIGPVFISEEYLLEDAAFKNMYLYGDYDFIVKENERVILLLLKNVSMCSTIYNILSTFIIEEYDEKENHLVLVLKLPEEYNEDFELFLKGKYSKFTKLASLYDKKQMMYFEKDEPAEWYSYQKCVVEKSLLIRVLILKNLDVDIDDYPEAFEEFCEKIHVNKETLDIDLIIKGIDEKYY